MAQTSLVLILLAIVTVYVLFSGKVSLGTTSIDTTPTGGWKYDGTATEEAPVGSSGGGVIPAPTVLDPQQSAPEDRSDGTKKYTYRGREVEGITTLLAAMGISMTLGAITSKIDGRFIEMQKRANITKALLNDSIEKGGEKIIQRSGAKLGVKAGEKVAVKGGQKMATQTAIKTASMTVPPLAIAEIAFTVFTGYMDSLDLGGFSKLSTMESLHATRDTIDEIFDNQIRELGGSIPLIYGPFDKLTDEDYETKIKEEMLKIVKNDIENGKIKSNSDYTDAYVDKVLDQSSLNLCKSLGGVSHGTNKCSFVKEDCNARWPPQIGDTYYEFRDGVCQVRPSLMRTMCEDMGLGVTYDMATGSCKLSETYCGRYGGSARLDGKGDCYIDKGQEIMEAVFGRTFVRSIVNIFNFKDNYEKCGAGQNEANELIAAGFGGITAQFFCSGSKCKDDEEKMMTTRGVDKQLGGLCYPQCKPGYKSYWGKDSTSRVAGMCYADCPPGYTPTSDYCTWNGSTTSNDVCPSDHPVRQGTQCFKSSVKKLAGGAIATTVPPSPDKCPDGFEEAGVGLCSKYKETCTAGVVNCKYNKTKCYCTKAVSESKIRGNSCPDGYTRTGPASCQADTIMAKLSQPRDSYTRRDTGIAYSVTPKKRKAPFPSTSESDFKNSTFGKYIQKGINSIRDGDSKGFGVAMGGMLYVNNPVMVAFGANELADKGIGKGGYIDLL